MFKLAEIGRTLYRCGREIVQKEAGVLKTASTPAVTQFRTKYNKSSSSQNVSLICFEIALFLSLPLFQDSDSDDEADTQLESDKSLMKTSVNSLRMDLIIKAGLGIARK